MITSGTVTKSFFVEIVAPAVEDAVDVGEVLPDEFADAGVVGNCVIAAAGDLVVRCRTLDAAIIHKGPHDVGDLQLEHEGDIVVKNGNCIGSALREVCEANHTNQGLDHGEVLGCDIYGAVIIPDEEVKHAVACLTSHTFNELVRKWGHFGVPNGDGVERLEVMHEVQRASLLFDTEPVGAV